MGHGALGTISRLSPAAIPHQTMPVVVDLMSAPSRSLRGAARQIIRRRCSSEPIDDPQIAHQPSAHQRDARGSRTARTAATLIRPASVLPASTRLPP
jgi:hypothetical protein